MAIAIEVSTTQKQVHVEDLVHTLVSNRRNVLMGVESDWILVDTAETAEEAVKKAAFWDGIMISRRDNNG
jgi:hypothetical protein